MFSRHELVWLNRQGWAAALARALPGQHAAIEQWRREDWPAIVRRTDLGLAADEISLGIALAPSPGGAKGRIALNALKADVARSSPALALAEAAKAAPQRWHAALGAMVAKSDAMALRAYGSLAMQAITGQAYVTPTSDIDLLFFPADRETLRAGLALLEEFSSILPLDGEIMFPSGAAVAWKEWISAGKAGARVLVKQLDTVRLAPAAQLLASMGGA